MLVRFRLWGFALCAWVVASAALSEPFKLDGWHFVCPESPFHAVNGSQRPSAAIAQSDGTFALLVLGNAGEGALVTVNLPNAERAERVQSQLVLSGGRILAREIEGEELWSETITAPASVTYAFRVPAADVGIFQKAMSWRIRAGKTDVQFVMKGSSAAIAMAIKARAGKTAKD